MLTLDQFNEAECYGDDGDLWAVRGDIDRSDAFERICTTDEELCGSDSYIRKEFKAGDLMQGVGYEQFSAEEGEVVPFVRFISAQLPPGTPTVPIWLLSL